MATNPEVTVRLEPELLGCLVRGWRRLPPVAVCVPEGACTLRLSRSGLRETQTLNRVSAPALTSKSGFGLPCFSRAFGHGRITCIQLCEECIMANTPVVTVRLEPELRKRLDLLAKSQRRSRSFVATEAIREYVKVNEWQIEETRKALAEADRGEFASPSEVRRVVKKWTERSARAR